MRNSHVAMYVLSGVLFAVTVPMYRYMLRPAVASPAVLAVSRPGDSSRVSPASRPSELSVDRAKLAVYRDLQSSRYDLLPDQRCVGGAVIEVHGSVYTQLGSLARPVHCVGRRADYPLR